MEKEKFERQDYESIYQLFPILQPYPQPPISSLLSGILFHYLQFCLVEIPLGLSYLIVKVFFLFFFKLFFCPAPKEAQLKASGRGGEAGNFELDALCPAGLCCRGKLRGQRTAGPSGREGAEKKRDRHLSLLPALPSPHYQG